MATGENQEGRIYCIEGHWDWGTGKEPSVEPMLEMLNGLDLWAYVRRDCATPEETKYWIQEEWWKCSEGSILYFATHGAPTKISLSKEHRINIDNIADYAGDGGCANCWVHFGGCSVLSGAEAMVKDFMSKTKATVVSGYTVDTGWASTGINSPPAVALELMLFSSAADRDVKLGDGRSRPRIEKIAQDLKERFPDCGFELYTKESIGL